jgi:8-oxo-dGTP pyrophosphatase MutT (NUDIX family)
VPAIVSSHVEVYLFRRRGRRVQFLVLRRSAGRRVLPGAWQPVTGKRLRGERPLRAAAREVLEETGLRPARWWSLETVTLYVEAASGRLVVLPLFAAEVGAAEAVARSGEHDAHAWLGARAAGRRFVWESQRRGLAAVRNEVLRPGPLADALEVTEAAKSGIARRPARGSRRRKR